MPSRPLRPAGPSPLAMAALAFAPASVLNLALRSGMLNLYQLVAALVAGFLLVLLARRPAPVFGVLVALLPFQLVLTSLLYALGVGGGLARMAALWKELAVLALGVAAFRRAQDHPGRIDPLDRLALAFVVLGTAYLVGPELFVPTAGASLSLDVRFTAWRFLVVPAVLFLVARRLRLTAGELRTVLRAVTASAVVLGLIGVAELFVSDLWNRVMVDVVGVSRYRTEVLGLDLARAIEVVDIRVYGEVAGRLIIRAGGPMVSQLTFSFVLLIALAVLLERALRRELTAPVLVGLLACGVGLLATQTRSSIVGAGVLVVVALRSVPGRAAARRVQVALVAVLLAAAALPLLLGAGLADRFIEGDSFSDTVHDVRVAQAVDAIEDHPLGLGLGMGSTAGGRPAEGSVPVENQLLDTAVQLGVLGAALLAALYAGIVVALGRAGPRAGPAAQVLVYGVQTAMLGLLVSLWYQQAFGLIEVSWVLFGLAGAALGAAERDGHDSTAAPERATVHA